MQRTYLLIQFVFCFIWILCRIYMNGFVTCSIRNPHDNCGFEVAHRLTGVASNRGRKNIRKLTLYRITRYIQFHVTDDINACDDYITITITHCILDWKMPSRSFILLDFIWYINVNVPSLTITIFMWLTVIIANCDTLWTDISFVVALLDAQHLQSWSHNILHG